jgi:protein-S-isoprenylcysteine O-methyltransferase Ste14
VAVLGVAEFRQANTTVDPRRPGRSARIVRGGVYAWTRNPMYLGFVAMLLGLAVALQSSSGLALAAVVAMYLHRFQILPEERWLSLRFGQEFVAYCAQVRRWL